MAFGRERRENRIRFLTREGEDLHKQVERSMKKAEPTLPPKGEKKGKPYAVHLYGSARGEGKRASSSIILPG